MNTNVAGGVARRIHSGQVSRSGEPLIRHVERVARGVPANVRALAYLHDVLERADGAVDEELHELGMSDDEQRVLALVTRRPEQSYRVYVMGIARADGSVGRIARTIKLADLDDHLRQRRVGARAPDYAWARRQIVASQRGNGEPQAVEIDVAKRVSSADRTDSAVGVRQAASPTP